jgi:hypothetical protein
MEPPRCELIAYEVIAGESDPPRPSPAGRDWMDASRERFAYRCLPLVMANRAGWVLPSPCRFSARWNGGNLPRDVRLWFGRAGADHRVASHFGEGVLTFTIPFLFRTPPGINLWVKGPSNWLKDGIQPLEGLVETDWAVATFTMNWRFTRPGHLVRFEAGEPCAMLVPVPRDLASSLRPRLRSITHDPRLHDQFTRWKEAREQFDARLSRHEPGAVRDGWQKDYMQGRDSDGAVFPNHQTTLQLRPFEADDLEP